MHSKFSSSRIPFGLAAAEAALANIRADTLVGGTVFFSQIHDGKKKLTKKLSKAYCPLEREGNPVLDIWQHLLEPALGDIVIERPEKFGGNLSFESYGELESSYLSGTLHPLDLKNGTASALFQLIKPMQDTCLSEPDSYNKLLSAIK